MNFKNVFLKNLSAARPYRRALLACRAEKASVGFVITLPLFLLSFFVIVQVWPSLDSQSIIENGTRWTVRQMDVRGVSVAPRIQPRFGSAERLAMDSLGKWTLDNSVITTRKNPEDSGDTWAE